MCVCVCCATLGCFVGLWCWKLICFNLWMVNFCCTLLGRSWVLSHRSRAPKQHAIQGWFQGPPIMGPPYGKLTIRGSHYWGSLKIPFLGWFQMTNCGMIFWRFQFDSLCFAYASPICKWSSSRLDSIGEFQVSRLHQKKFMSGSCQRVKGALKKCSWTSEFKMLWTDFVSWLSYDMLMLSKHETFHTFTRRIQMAVEILISKSSWSSWHKCGPWRNLCD